MSTSRDCIRRSSNRKLSNCPERTQHPRSHLAWAGRDPWASPAPCRCAQTAAPGAAARQRRRQRPPASPRPSCGNVRSGSWSCCFRLDVRARYQQKVASTKVAGLPPLLLHREVHPCTATQPQHTYLTGSMRPSRLRVPSGKMCTQSPAARRDCTGEGVETVICAFRCSITARLAKSSREQAKPGDSPVGTQPGQLCIDDTSQLKTSVCPAHLRQLHAKLVQASATLHRQHLQERTAGGRQMAGELSLRKTDGHSWGAGHATAGRAGKQAAEQP